LDRVSLLTRRLTEPDTTPSGDRNSPAGLASDGLLHRAARSGSDPPGSFHRVIRDARWIVASPIFELRLARRGRHGHELLAHSREKGYSGL